MAAAKRTVERSDSGLEFPLKDSAIPSSWRASEQMQDCETAFEVGLFGLSAFLLAGHLTKSFSATRSLV